MALDRLRAYMEQHENEMLEDLKTLIRIPSERMEALPGMPFGEPAAKALEAAGRMLGDYGFHVTNYDNYAVAADLNQKPKALDILAHLDVVPAGEGWQVTGAYTPAIVDGKIYGRGAADDKGPAIAAMYAMRAIKALGYELSANVRLVLGSDEECGSSDLDYYYARETEAPCTFSPDADFPVINVEKGGLHSSFCRGLESSVANGIRLERIAAGTKINVVPGKAQAWVGGMTLGELKDLGCEVAEAAGVSFSYVEVDSAGVGGTNASSTNADRTSIMITANGQFAHAASPETGNNALTALLMLLARIPFTDSAVAEAIDCLSTLWPHGDFEGRALGVAQADAVSGCLTMSLNLLSYDGRTLEGSFDCRAPLCANDGNTRCVIEKRLAQGGFVMDKRPMYPPHHVPADSPFVRTLLDCYTAVTGLPGKTLAIGGGTYVHDLKSGVAFGCGVAGVDNHMHGADEFMDIAHLKQCAVIFAEAILRLCGADTGDGLE